MFEKEDRIILFRVLACLGVFLVHLGQRVNWTGMLRTFSDYGQYGVQLFFIVSGYLACVSLSHEKSKFKYWYKRILRICPLYYFVIFYFYVTETFVFRDVPVDDTGLGWVRYIFFLPGLLHSESRFWRNLGITWTIPVFLLFYLLIPFILKKVNDFRRTWIFLILTILMSLFVERYCNGNFLSFRYLYFFVFGILLYFGELEEKKNTLILGGSIILLVMKILEYNSGDVCALLFLLMLIATKDLKFRVRTVKTIIFTIDKYSYSIYLSQGIIFCGILDKFDMPLLPRYFIAIGGTILLSFFSLNCVERPIRNLAQKHIKM